MMMQNPKHTFRTRQHYTLIELMIVMFIVVTLLALVGGAMQSGSSDIKLQNTVRMVNAQLTRARSLAVQTRENVTVDFSSNDFFCLKDHNGDEIADTRVYWESGVVRPNLSNVTFNSRGGANTTATIQLAVPDKDGNFDPAKSPHYYEITVNQYTGRATTEFHED